MHTTERLIRDACFSELLILAEMAGRYESETIFMRKHKLDYDVLMQSLAGTITSPEGYLRVMVIDNKIVGALWGILTHMPWSSVKFAQDLILFVDEDYRGNGKALIDDWIQWAKSVGAQEVCLSTASGMSTERTTKLFSHYGFNLVGHSYTKEI